LTIQNDRISSSKQTIHNQQLSNSQLYSNFNSNTHILHFIPHSYLAMADQPAHQMSQNTNGLPVIMQPQPIPIIQPSSRERIVLGPLSTFPPANDLESTDGSGHGSPVQTASVASPLPPQMLTAAALEYMHTGGSSPSNMPEIGLLRRPAPAQLAADDVDSPKSLLSMMPPLPYQVIIDYSHLIKRDSREQPLSRTTEQLGTSIYPKPCVIMEISLADTLSTTLTKISTEVLNQHAHNFDHMELAVEQMGKIQLRLQLMQESFGQVIVHDERTFRQCLEVMRLRGWKDFFYLKFNDQLEKLKDLNVPSEIEVSEGNAIDKEESRRRGCSINSSERVML